jgi:hypothetical protein
MHREATDDPVVVSELAGEVSQFLRDAEVPLSRFVRELQRVHRAKPARRARR